MRTESGTCSFSTQDVVIFRFFFPQPSNLPVTFHCVTNSAQTLLGSQEQNLFFPICLVVRLWICSHPFCSERFGGLFDFYYCFPFTLAQLLTPSCEEWDHIYTWKNSPRYILSLDATEQLTLLPKASNLVETTVAGQGQQVVFATASF